HHVRSRLEHERGVLRAFATGDALDDDLGFCVKENGHGSLVLFYLFASSAALSAPASMVSAWITSGWSAFARIWRPWSTLLPSRRTTSGLLASSPSMFSAGTITLATASHEGMPPNTLTNTLLTCLSFRITSRPAAITSADAPPPMSRKLAGLTPPCFSPAYATTSSVDITRPAPLPMMPTC